jgi:hypothetical protein
MFIVPATAKSRKRWPLKSRIYQTLLQLGIISLKLYRFYGNDLACADVAGWSSPVARKAHNLEVGGSNPSPATNFKEELLVKCASLA